MTITMGSSVLINFGWPFLATVRPEVTLPMLMPLTFMLFPFQLELDIAFLALIFSVTIVLTLPPPTLLAIELQYLF